MTNNYRPSRLTQLTLLVFVLPVACLMFLAGTRVADRENLLVGVSFIAAAAALLAFLVFNLTMRVVVDERSVTRSWLLGSTTVQVSEITRFAWAGARGVLILTISYGKRKFIQLSSNALTKEELRGIYKDLLAKALAAQGLEGQPLRPLFSESVGYVDIAEMVRIKCR